MDVTNGAALLLLSWLLTYLIHGTLLIGGVWAIGKILGKRKLVLQETLWKAALIGGLVTASLQTGLNVEPLGGVWRLAGSALEPPSAAIAPATEAPVSIELAIPPIPEDQVPEETTSPLPVLAASPVKAQSPGLVPPSWQVLTVGFWLLGASIFCGLLFFSYTLLHLRLKEGDEVVDGPLPLLLARILSGSGMVRTIMLHYSQRLESPIAMGVWRPRIVVPQKALATLSEEEQETMLAHEVAHIRHSDPFWLLLSRIIESVFFFQPLNRLARIRLQELAEYRCDDWAVSQTGKPLALAKCLTEVAQWRVAGSSYPVPGMADGSELGSRVRRLVDSDKNLAPNKPLSRGLTFLVLPVLVLVAWAVPGFQGKAPVAETVPSNASFPVVETVIPQVARTTSLPEAPTPVQTAPTVATAPVREQAPPASTRPKQVGPVASKAALPTAATAPVSAPSLFLGTSQEADAKPAPLPQPALASAPATTLIVQLGDDDGDNTLEIKLDALEEDWDLRLETYEDEFDRQVGRFEDDFEFVMDRAADKAERNWLRRMREDAIEEKFDDFEDEAEQILEQFEDELDVIEDRFDLLLESIKALDPEQIQDLDQSLDEALVDWRFEYTTAMNQLEKRLAKMKRKYN